MITAIFSFVAFVANAQTPYTDAQVKSKKNPYDAPQYPNEDYRDRYKDIDWRTKSRREFNDIDNVDQRIVNDNKPARIQSAKQDLPKVKQELANTNFRKDNSLRVEGGARTDRISWSRAGSGSIPNTEFESMATDLEIYQVKVVGDLVFLQDQSKAIYLNGSYADGKIRSGGHQESTYGANNRNDEYDRLFSRVEGGVMDYDLSLNGDINFPISETKMFSVTPMIGYAVYDQSLNFRHGYRTKAGSPAHGNFIGSHVGEFEVNGLNSTYQSRWKGSFVGLGTSFVVNNKHYLKVAGKYHRARYKAKGDWNTDSTYLHPVSFEHTARADGFIGDVEYRFKQFKNLSYVISGNVRSYKTGNGKMTERKTTGNSVYRLNEVKWNSFYLAAGISLDF